jgi:hypothetical protein
MKIKIKMIGLEAEHFEYLTLLRPTDEICHGEWTFMGV